MRRVGHGAALAVGCRPLSGVAILMLRQRFPNVGPPLRGDGLTPRPPDPQSLTANFRTPTSSGKFVIQSEFEAGSVGQCMSSVVSAQVLRELTHRLPRWLDGSVWVLRVIGGSVPAFGIHLERARQLLRELTLIDSLRRVRE